MPYAIDWLKVINTVFTKLKTVYTKHLNKTILNFKQEQFKKKTTSLSTEYKDRILKISYKNIILPRLVKNSFILVNNLTII